MDVKFTEKIDSLKSPLADATGNGKIWSLSSKTFDDNLNAGTVLELRFEAFFSSNIPDVFSLVFNGKELCDEGIPTTTTTTEPAEDCSDALSVESEDDDSWHGMIEIIAAEDISGWELFLSFNQPADAVETPLGKVSGSGKEWIIINSSFDGDLDEGDIMQLRFEVYFTGEKPEVVHLSFNGASLCKSLF